MKFRSNAVSVTIINKIRHVIRHKFNEKIDIVLNMNAIYKIDNDGDTYLIRKAISIGAEKSI